MRLAARTWSKFVRILSPMSTPDPCMNQVIRLNQECINASAANAAYIQQHPELSRMLDRFVRTALDRKPEHLLDFAREYFTTYNASDEEKTVETTQLPPLVIAGPSGSGKGTLISALLQRYPGDFGFSVSHTTRGPRPGEVNGVQYHFVDKATFEAEVARGQFLEHAHVHSNMYGTSFRAVRDVQAQGKICVLDIDIQGVKQVKAANSPCRPHFVFVAAPSMEELERRLRGRGTETEEKIQIRMGNAIGEMDYGLQEGNFDKVLINDNLEECLQELIATLKKWYPHLDRPNA